MQKLGRSRDAWNTPAFRDVFKREAGQLGVAVLPLQQGLSRSSHVSGSKYEVVVLNASEDAQRILVKAGVFYNGIIAGCSCADDPTPVDEQTEYCVLQFGIDKRTAEAEITLLDED
ncbi:hypothetical protein F8A87_01265 [Betaproteobacteria bacterium SCN2]|jgi:hypothetical protein|nr:hypothetical protein F8A87_01265 [Betaproteobacteria bacterium SCN2]